MTGFTGLGLWSNRWIWGRRHFGLSSAQLELGLPLHPLPQDAGCRLFLFICICYFQSFHVLWLENLLHDWPFQVESLYAGQGSQHPSWQSPVFATLSSLPVTRTDSACVCVCVYINLYHVHVHTHGNGERLSSVMHFPSVLTEALFVLTKHKTHVVLNMPCFQWRTAPLRLEHTADWAWLHSLGWTLPILLNRCTWERPFPRDGQLCSLPAFHSYEPSCNKQPYLYWCDPMHISM